MKKNHFYKGVNPTVDLIVVNPFEEILMVKRSSQSKACPSMLAFPGGFIDSDATEGQLWQSDLESPRDAAIRELAEETGLVLDDEAELILVGEYQGNNRDPRDSEFSWTKTYAFLYLIDLENFEKQKGKIKGQDDADEARWIKISELRQLPLAFDHNIILEDAIKLF